MTERKIFMLESYYLNGNKDQLWRITNSEGLSWREDINQYTLVPPVYCRSGVFEEMTRVQSLLECTGDRW